jgi:hypothetical protein
MIPMMKTKKIQMMMIKIFNFQLNYKYNLSWKAKWN